MSIEQILQDRLDASFNPTHLEVVNESHMHNVPANSETHFKVVIVSNGFEGLRKVKRHQEVYGLVGDLLDGELHALALHTYTPQEWVEVQGAPASPNCRGGGA